MVCCSPNRHGILTLQGMYDYDNTIFDNIVIPTGMEKDTLVSTILMMGGENEIRYPSYPLLTNRINLFFKMHKIEFQKIWDTENFEYNPIHNYDRTEMETIDLQQNINKQFDQSDTNTVSSESASDENVTSTTTPNLTNEQKVSAFNSTGYLPKEQTTQTGTNAITSTDHVTGEQSGKSVRDNMYTDDTDRKDNTNRKLTASGNIGVMSTQEMIKQEREISDFSTYYYIASKFENEITIPVY